MRLLQGFNGIWREMGIYVSLRLLLATSPDDPELSYPALATMVRISLMYYVDFYSLFNNPEKDWENIMILDDEPPPRLTLF